MKSPVVQSSVRKTILRAPRSRGILLAGVDPKEETLSDILVWDPRSLKVTNLTHHASMEYDPAWSPDHRQIAFIAYDLQQSLPQVYVMSADGSKRHRLTAGGDAKSGPSWSPDGKRIVFACQRTNGSTPQHADTESHSAALVIADVDSGRTRLIGSGFRPKWSPNGHQILYSAPDTQGTEALWIINTDGTNRHLLSAGCTDGAWSPDGRWIAIVGTPDGARGILATVHPDGSGRAVLVKGSYSCVGPVWREDGSGIAYTRLDSDSPTIWLVNLADGQQSKLQVTGFTGAFLGATVGAWLSTN
jgi:TolB protein